jgi:L-threonylcarbamoyladenylate synthase
VTAPLRADDVARLDRSIAAGGVALIPTDTVYGLACDPDSRDAVQRLYEIKGRPADRPAAVMFGSLNGALAALDWLSQGERSALRALLPGPVTVLLANPQQRFPLACLGASTIGVRVPMLSGRLAALGALARPLMQTSANISGEAEAKSLAEVDPRVRAGLRPGLDVELDGGALPGAASTVLDLTAYASGGGFHVVREGPVSAAEVARLLASARSS